MACLMCGCEKFNRVTNVDEPTVVKCLSCNFVYTIPLPDESSVRDLYENWTDAGDQFQPRGGLGRRLKYRLFANSIKKYFPKHQLIKLLEIGCGQGDLQRAIKHDERIKGVGLDLDKSALNYARSLDLDVREGTLEEQNFLSKTYDCVVAIHVIEHLYNPIKTLSEIYRILTQGGIFIAIVPCVTHIKARINGKRWKYYHAPGHLWHFSPETFRLLLSKVNLQPVSMFSFYNRAHLKTIAKKID